MRKTDKEVDHRQYEKMLLEKEENEGICYVILKFCFLSKLKRKQLYVSGTDLI